MWYSLLKEFFGDSALLKYCSIGSGNGRLERKLLAYKAFQACGSITLSDCNVPTPKDIERLQKEVDWYQTKVNYLKAELPTLDDFDFSHNVSDFLSSFISLRFL